MSRDIAESRRELELEQSEVRRAFGREKEQRSTLDHLGLNEIEAVEYVLMLSRDEEEERRLRDNEIGERAAASSSNSSHADGDGDVNGRGREDEELFFGDLDELQTPSPASLAVFRSRAETSWARTSALTSTSPRIAPSTSNIKVEVSPRLLPEPVEAGFSTSPLGSSRSVSSSFRIPPPIGDTEHFPAISPGHSSPATNTSMSVGSTPASSSLVSASISMSIPRRSMSGSPESYRSAWSTPLRATQSMSSALSSPSLASSPPHAYAITSRSPAGVTVRSSGPSLLSAEIARQLDGMSIASAVGPARSHAHVGGLQREREEEDLRFAIELSLAEARSRGESV